MKKFFACAYKSVDVPKERVARSAARCSAPKRLHSAYFGQQLVVFGRYQKPGEVDLKLKGRISGEELSWETTFDLPEHDERFPEVVPRERRLSGSRRVLALSSAGQSQYCMS